MKTARSHGIGQRVRAAFTFAEVLAAMVFMAIVIPVAMQGLQIASRAGAVAQRKALAIELGNAQLQELLTNFQWQSGGQGGTFPGWPNFRWRLTHQPWVKAPGMREVSIEVFYTVQNQEYEVRLSTLIQDPNYQ